MMLCVIMSIMYVVQLREKFWFVSVSVSQCLILTVLILIFFYNIITTQGNKHDKHDKQAAPTRGGPSVTTGSLSNAVRVYFAVCL